MFNLVVQIDLKKAFDAVDHQMLLRKLEIYGIKHQALALLKSYLSYRNQKCDINRYLSSKKMIKCGIPQGSILGPYFFYYPRANGAKRRARVLIPQGYLHPGKGKHSEV